MNQADQLIATFCRFVQIDSITDEEQKISHTIKKELEEWGYSVFQDERYNLIISTPGSGEPLLLAAHLDTVEPGRGIKPLIKDGVVYSDGTTILGSDNKATVTVLFELLRWLKTQKSSAVRPLDIVFSVSEERGVSGIDSLDLTKVRAKQGLTIDSSRPVGSIVLSSPWYMSVKATFTGRDSHASRPEAGLSIVPALTEFLQTLSALPLETNTRLNIGMIQAGESLNSLASQGIIQAELRSFSKETLLHLQSVITEISQHLAATHQCQVVLQAQLENDGYLTTAQDPLIQAIVQSFSLSNPSLEGNLIPQTWGLSDANNLNRRGIKTINLGYGAEEIHTVRERIAVQNLVQLTDFLQRFVQN